MVLSVPGCHLTLLKNPPREVDDVRRLRKYQPVLERRSANDRENGYIPSSHPIQPVSDIRTAAIFWPSESSAATKAPQAFQESVRKFVPTKMPLLSSGMTAEGFRKIGVLQRLLSNGSLNPGTTGPLLWDEPESNLNPKLMKDLVSALLELARNGQQVILATHDYVLLKWFDLLMDKGKGDQVVFHRLYRAEGSDVVQRESQADYNIVGRSAISNTFAELYDEDVKRALGGD